MVLTITKVTKQYTKTTKLDVTILVTFVYSL